MHLDDLLEQVEFYLCLLMTRLKGGKGTTLDTERLRILSLARMLFHTQMTSGSPRELRRTKSLTTYALLPKLACLVRQPNISSGCRGNRWFC